MTKLYAEEDIKKIWLQIFYFFIRSMGGTEKTKLYAEEDIAKLAVLKSNDTVAKK